MTGTSRNSTEEIQFILDMFRAKVPRDEIAKKCKERWKHRNRSASSVSYVINTYKNNPEYTFTPAPVATAAANASMSYSNVQSTARQACQSRQAVNMNGLSQMTHRNQGQRFQPCTFQQSNLPSHMTNPYPPRLSSSAPGQRFSTQQQIGQANQGYAPSTHQAYPGQVKQQYPGQHPTSHQAQRFSSPPQMIDANGRYMECSGLVHPSMNLSPLVGYQQTQNADQIPSSHPLAHINEPYKTQTAGSPNTSGAAPNSTYPVNQALAPVQREARPDMILFRPSFSGRDKIFELDGLVFQQPFNLTGWTVTFPPNGPYPPYGSEVLKLYKPQFLGQPDFFGCPINVANLLPTQAEVPAAHDEAHANAALEIPGRPEMKFLPANSPIQRPSPGSTYDLVDRSMEMNNSNVRPSALSHVPTSSSLPSPTPANRAISSPRVKVSSTGSTPFAQQSGSKPISQNYSPAANHPKVGSIAQKSCILTPQAHAAKILKHPVHVNDSKIVSPPQPQQPTLPSAPIPTPAQVTTAPFIPDPIHPWGSNPPAQSNGAKPGTLTLPTPPTNWTPATQTPKNNAPLTKAYLQQPDFRSKPSGRPKAKTSKLQAEPTVPEPEPSYVMNHAKTGIITETVFASLRREGNYLISSEIAASKKRKLDNTTPFDSKEQAEKAKKIKHSAQKEQGERQPPTPSNYLDEPASPTCSLELNNSNTGSTATSVLGSAATPSVSVSDSPSPALSTSLPLRSQLNEPKKGKFDDIDSSDDSPEESAKKTKAFIEQKEQKAFFQQLEEPGVEQNARRSENVDFTMTDPGWLAWEVIQQDPAEDSVPHKTVEEFWQYLEMLSGQGGEVDELLGPITFEPELRRGGTNGPFLNRSFELKMDR